MNIFISGGCKNGKSYHAQHVAQKMAQEKNLPLYYLATIIPTDEEDNIRIKRHIADRQGWGFETIEQGLDILKCLEGKTLSGEKVNSKGVFLLDSVTALLSNEMFRADGSVFTEAPQKVSRDLVEFCRLTGNTVFVSDYIYSDAARYEKFTEDYRKGLAFIDKNLAKTCDQVTEVSYSFINNYK